MKIELAEGLVVGPDDRLIIKFPGDFPMEDEQVEDLIKSLVAMGLKDRVLVIFGDEIEVTKIESG